MNYNVVDKTMLTDIQRRNLACMRIKNALVKRQYGSGIEIITPLEEVLSATGPCTIPMAAINTDKQLSIFMDGIKEELDGTIVELYDKENPEIAGNVESLTAALERTADFLEKAIAQRNSKPASKKAFKVPKGYKLVKIEDDIEDTDAECMADEADTAVAANDIGSPVLPSRDEKPTAIDKDEAIRSLLDLLV